MDCPNCGYSGPAHGPAPAEPAIGTWVKDRHGVASVRRVDSDGNDGWSPGPSFYSAAKWEPMWGARGPLVECGPYGREE
jgi:hypothetical protein